METWIETIALISAFILLGAWLNAAILSGDTRDDMFWGDGPWLARWYGLARQKRWLWVLNLIGLSGLALAAISFVAVLVF